jgi:hypothetical protein
VVVVLAVVVVAPGDVAAIGSGDATVRVIKPGIEHAPCGRCDRFRGRAALSESAAFARVRPRSSASAVADLRERIVAVGP